MCIRPRAGGEVGATGVVGGSRTGPEALLFDMDGVLADVRRSYRESIVRTCASFGVEAGHELISAVKAAGGANDDWAVTHGVLAGAGVEASLEEVTARFEEIYQGTEAEPGLRRHETLIPSRELLEGLARSFRLGIVTGRPRADAQRFLREQGVRGCFSAVVCREDAPLKPDPAPVLAALEQLDARTAWMLGDTPDDVRAAVGAGVVPVGVVPPGQTEQAATAVWAALEDAGAARVVNADSDFGGLFDG
ncbi:MAG: HAD-IA family hydrolase [Gemmatimonadetes bacterium]|nr:HAD-IA family hydrolase [Gemmatimonadota bacterium]